MALYFFNNTLEQSLMKTRNFIKSFPQRSNMKSNKFEYPAINEARFLLKLVGYWFDFNSIDQLLGKFIVAYCMIAIIIGEITQIVDTYIIRKDFDAVADNLCTIIILTIALVKTVDFLVQRHLVAYVIECAENEFWRPKFDSISRQIILSYDTRCHIFIYVFALMAILVVLTYIFRPEIENYFENEKVRELPFTFYLPFDVLASPAYELLYTLQSMLCCQVGVCSVGYDTFMCTINMHVAAQFKILSNKIETFIDKYIEDDEVNGLLGKELPAKAYDELKENIRKHRDLIHYVKKTERLFCMILLGVVLLSSMALCVSGYRLMSTDSPAKLFINFIVLIGVLLQLFMHMWTCNDIMLQSTSVAMSAFRLKWYLLHHKGYEKAMKKTVIILIIRAQKPCVMTAGKFGILSMQTISSVVSTAVSYLTMIRTVKEI